MEIGSKREGVHCLLRYAGVVRELVRRGPKEEQPARDDCVDSPVHLAAVRGISGREEGFWGEKM